MGNVPVGMERVSPHNEEDNDETGINSFEMYEFSDSDFVEKIANFRKLNKRKNKIQEDYLQVIIKN